MGYEALAEATGMTSRTAKRHVKFLVGMGLIVKIERGGIDWTTGQTKANRYVIPGREGAFKHDGV